MQSPVLAWGREGSGYLGSAEWKMPARGDKQKRLEGLLLGTYSVVVLWGSEGLAT